MRRMRMVLAALTALLLAGALPAMAQAKWGVIKTVHIGGEGGWDYVTVDAQTHRVFVTRSTHTMVIDGTTGKVLGDIPGQKRSHGTALVPAVNRGFITDGGGDGAIVVFDLTTYATLGKLATMPDSDGIIYDPEMNLVLAVSGDGEKLMTFKPEIDPVNGKIDPPIDLGGKPEFLAYGDDGKAYINLENKDLVAEVDLKTRQVIARWPVAPAGAGGHVDRPEEPAAVRGLPQPANDDRDRYEGRQGAGEFADRRGRGRDQVSRWTGVRKLPRRVADGGGAKRRTSSRWSRW